MVESARPAPINNLPIAFKPLEFGLGVFIAAGIVFLVGGTRWYVRAKSASAANVCQQQVQQIETAKASWAAASARSADATVVWDDLLKGKPFMGKQPVCPAGGSYILGSANQPAKCSAQDHRGDK